MNFLNVWYLKCQNYERKRLSWYHHVFGVRTKQISVCQQSSPTHIVQWTPVCKVQYPFSVNVNLIGMCWKHYKRIGVSGHWTCLQYISKNNCVCKCQVDCKNQYEIDECKMHIALHRVSVCYKRTGKITVYPMHS